MPCQIIYKQKFSLLSLHISVQFLGGCVFVTIEKYCRGYLLWFFVHVQDLVFQLNPTKCLDLGIFLGHQMEFQYWILFFIPKARIPE